MSSKNEPIINVLENTNTQLSAINNSLIGMTNKKYEEFNPMISESERKRAAYALNLCLVSISQIIDYADEVILEQEYNAILNNINMRNIPKDEALLDILKQILDTVTFFRIQDIRKNAVEKDYQNKMKNAIWSAVPNFAIILNAANPIAIASTLATQVGIGYMNYRRAKAESQSEVEKQMTELQIAAIEQLNGLRRELFTTAWRLAEKYNFDEEWRLTEPQITNYNKILNDTNPYRRLERLEDIAGDFQAYPPFWYFKAHAALEIVNIEKEKNTKESKDYSKIAGQYYKEYFNFFEDNNKDIMLLREDEIYATCALEYVQILNDEALKVEYIKKAENIAKTKKDVLQLCSIAYLQSEKTDEACRLLRKLVREDYNADANIQLLGGLYIRQFLSSDPKDSEKYRKEYLTLCNFTPINECIPFPEKCNKENTKEEIEKIGENLAYQKKLLLTNQHFILLYQYYDLKQKEYAELLNIQDSKEFAFVKFIKKMQSEIFDMEKVLNIQFGDVINAIKDNENIIKWVNDTSKTLPNFDDVFDDVFVEACKSVNLSRISTMAEISKIEINILTCIEKYAVSSEEPKNLCLREGLADLLHNSNEHPDITKLKNIINKDNLISDPNTFELLMYGEAKYNRYIYDNKLSNNEVVAVLHDKKMGDDILFLQNSIWVKPKLWKKIVKCTVYGAMPGIAILVPFSLIPSIIIAGAGSAINTFGLSLPSPISYNDVKHSRNKLTKPAFNDKALNAEILIKIIDELKTAQPKSTLNKMKIEEQSKMKEINNFHPLCKLVTKKTNLMMKALNNIEFSKNKYSKQKDAAIKAGQEWIENYDVENYSNQLDAILNDSPYSAIADQIQIITNILKKIK